MVNIYISASKYSRVKSNSTPGSTLAWNFSMIRQKNTTFKYLADNTMMNAAISLTFSQQDIQNHLASFIAHQDTWQCKNFSKEATKLWRKWSFVVCFSIMGNLTTCIYYLFDMFNQTNSPLGLKIALTKYGITCCRNGYWGLRWL